MAEVIGQAQVYEYGQFYYRDKYEGQGYALFHYCDNYEYRRYGYRIYHLEIVVGGFYHVLHAGRLAYQHAAWVIPLEYSVKAVYLPVHLVACDLVFGIYQQQLRAPALQRADKLLGKQLLRHLRAQHAFKAEDVLYAGDLLHVLCHLPHLAWGERGIHQQHVCRGHVKRFGQLFVCHDVLYIAGQALPHVVIDLLVGLFVSVVGRGDQKQEDKQEYRKYAAHLLGKGRHIGYQGPMAGRLQRLVEQQYERRQHCYAAYHAQKHPLRHDEAEVAPQGEGHKAQRGKARNGSGGAADDGQECVAYCGGHGLLAVRYGPQLFVVAVPEEYGVVHGDGKLQYGG